jgi:uncharacterized membrane protein HdeD (DUF308 family)
MVDRISGAEFEAALLEARKQIAEHWRWFFALGIALILAGFLAIAFPFLSTIAAKIALGWIFLVSGRSSTRSLLVIGAAFLLVC